MIQSVVSFLGQSDIFQAARHSVIALCLAVFAGSAVAQESGQQRPETFTLDNGLTAIVLRDHRAPVVTHVIWYRVGSADDVTGKSGLAHFFEHLMFKATETTPAGEYKRIAARNGGQINARTSYDYTNYFFRVARDRLPLMMQLEADRMANLVLDDREVFAERSVVQQERRQVVDSNPGAVLDEQVREKLYAGHPYAVPVIGKMDEVARLSRADALDWYRTWYGPENAVLVVAGDITAHELKPLAEATFGRFRAGAISRIATGRRCSRSSSRTKSRMRTRRYRSRAGRETGSACRWGIRMPRRFRWACRFSAGAGPGGSIAEWLRADVQ